MAEKSVVLGLTPDYIGGLLDKELESHRKEMAHLEGEKHRLQVEVDKREEKVADLDRDIAEKTAELELLGANIQRLKDEVEASRKRTQASLEAQENKNLKRQQAAEQAEAQANEAKQHAATAAGKLHGLRQDTVKTLAALKAKVVHLTDEAIASLG